MRSSSAGEWRITYGIGLGCGLVGGLIGVVQWVLTARDFAARLAAFHAVQQRDPGFIDGTDTFQGNLWFWFGTAPLAAFAVLVFCLLAALTACLLLWSRRTGMIIDWLAAAESRRDGVIAAWVAATVAGSIWLVAALVAIATPPIPYAIDDFVTCEALLGVLVFGILIPLAPRAARMGMRVGQFFSRSRHAR